jgi:hypothetical protein
MLSLLVSVTGAQIGRSAAKHPARIAGITIEVFVYPKCLLEHTILSNENRMSGAAGSRESSIETQSFSRKKAEMLVMRTRIVPLC